ncbi:MAG: M20 family metallo-hydrolase [Thermonemataceae bacterium]
MLSPYTQKAIALLESLITIPSFSSEEQGTADYLAAWFTEQQIPFQRHHHNIWSKNQYFHPDKPTILLNSHHDTVRPNQGYTRDPFDPALEGGKLYGLGSNDAGGSLVALLTTFAHYYAHEDLSYNLIVAATAEEENSGKHGLRSLLPLLPTIDFAIVGEPTSMQLAVAEKGLLVVDAYAHGKAGHAAHDHTENAIYKALQDIMWIKSYQFPLVSSLLGAVKMSVTQIEAGKQHNIVPAVCHFVVDVRFHEQYSSQEIFEVIDASTQSELKARSFQSNSSGIALDHPTVKAAIHLGYTTYGSPTLSDQAVLSCPSVKIGPGVSARSHSANEYIELQEIAAGIEGYIQLLHQILI